MQVKIGSPLRSKVILFLSVVSIMKCNYVYN
jgi:hypothetical protein